MQARVCDVYGTAKDVKEYKILVQTLATDLGGGEPTGMMNVATEAADLCPRGLERLLAKIKAGVTPPTPRNPPIEIEPGIAS